MARFVRNFWIEATVDGRHEKIAAGPRDKGGGFDLVIKQRHEKGITTALKITGHADGDRLTLHVARQDHEDYIGYPNGFQITTQR